jgi:hypothetical protein
MAKAAENEGIFHLTSASHLLYCLEAALKRYMSSKPKRIEDAFFLIMGANHLREWIAPGYRPTFDHDRPSPLPNTEAEKFYVRIFDNADFKIVRGLCNRAKHLSVKCKATDYTSGLTIDEWDLIDDVVDFDEGPPTGFFVDETEVSDILLRLLDEYRRDWFERELTEDVSN